MHGAGISRAIAKPHDFSWLRGAQDFTESYTERDVSPWLLSDFRLSLWAVLLPPLRWRRWPLAIYLYPRNRTGTKKGQW